MRLLFIGQAPSRETDGQPPFVGRCGAFLAGKLLGITQPQMLDQHDFLNVFDRWPGAGVGGDKFPIPQARVRARQMLPQLRNRRVVLLGHNVARAFDCNQFSYLELYQMQDPDKPGTVIVPVCVVLPHPSGINRHWNSLDNVVRARVFLQNLIKE